MVNPNTTFDGSKQKTTNHPFLLKFWFTINVINNNILIRFSKI